MKVKITTGKLTMTITGNQNDRPIIQGELWDVMKEIPITTWLLLYGQKEVSKYPEIDLITAMMKDKASTVKIIEPLYNWNSPDGTNI